MRPAGAAARGATREPAVEFRDVSVAFPRRERAVLRRATFTIAPGERVVLFGPSGAGKSTLLAAITGVVPHSVIADVTGVITVAGRETLSTEVAILSRGLGVVPQDPDSGVCLPLVDQELALVLENRAVPRAEIADRIDSALTAVGAEALRTRSTATLSGGESQRVALAAALIGIPDVLVLDEPTSMLDAEGLCQVRDAIDSAARRAGVAVVLVEHRLDEYAGTRGISGLPERSIVLGADGAIRHDGPTASVLASAAADLHDAGCWLPCETELQAVFGVSGGLASPAVRRELLELAGAAGDGTGVEGPPKPAFGPIVLSSRDLAVSRDPAVRPARRRGGRFRRARQPANAPHLLVDRVDIDLRAGEVVAILGRNGSGKSSLLLTLAGLLAAAGGDVAGDRPGLVFQNPEHQFLANTVREEVAFGLPAGGGERVDRLLNDHLLTHLAGQNPFRLSGGEKRRLSIAAMLAHDRPSLLADEPTLGLDRRSAIAVIEAFRRAAAEGRGILLSSHDLRTVATLADRVLVVAEGRIIADGPVFDVLRDPGVLARAGITVPPLLEWLVAHLDSGARVRRVLDALDASVGPAARGPSDASSDVGSAVTGRTT